MRSLDWEDLRHFAAFVQARSLSAAAARLGVDHATVARRIASLEAALEVKLLDRRERIPRLTAEGERIAERTARMEGEASSIARVARGLQSRIAGEVSVSAPPTMASALIAPHLPALRALHPELRLRLIGDKRIVSLSRREADLALRLTRPDEDGLVARRAGTFTFSLYASSAYLASHRPRQFEFVSLDDESPMLPYQRWLRLVAGERPIVMRTSDLDSLAATLQAGAGLGVLPDYFAARLPELVRVPVRERPLEREVWLVVHDDLRRSKAVRAVMDFLLGVLAKLA